ncbi:DUF5677 domain-containing protein [Lentzea kentuckyensis]|uniref:DUF5677 domain-containing protein n=1 Tax=Lentzea kentuckyensis TaxID=360086 RepID=UPI000A37F6DF|nr:DUF5677 domain-containing protein [Lentzea kentuckyensis]
MVVDDARAGFTPLLKQMLPLYLDTLAGGRPPVREGYQQVAYLAHGWYLRCHRGIESILILDEAGYIEEAAPIRRSILEHTLALRWLAAEGDSIIDTIARSHARNSGKRHEAVSEAGWTSVDLDQVRRDIDEINADTRDGGNDSLMHFLHRLKAYGEVHELPGYLAETARCHPTYESAICYTELPGGGALPESRQPVPPVPFATTQLLRALQAVREIFNPPPWETVLTGVLGRYRTVVNDVRVQDGLAPIDWDGQKPYQARAR